MSHNKQHSQLGEAVEAGSGQPAELPLRWQKFLPDDYLGETAIAKYNEACRHLQNSVHVDFPQIISFETTATCNAACHFCPYPNREDKGAVMPDDLVAKILRDMADIPSHAPFHVTLARINEPFLDKRIFDIAREINRTIPHASLIFFSNGSPLNERALDQLAALERVYVLNISFNDHRPAEYEETMRIPYARTVERLDALHRRAAGGGITFGVRVSRVSDGSPADQDFIRYVRERWPFFDVANYRKSDWLGTVQTEVSAVPDAGCQQWFTVSLLADGRQTYCCLDSDGRFGTQKNVRDHHLLELYNLPERRALRGAVLSRKDVAICRGCSLLA